DPKVMCALERIMQQTTAGDPMSLLRWTCKSTETIAAELRHRGHSISPDTVGRRLQEVGYSLQSNIKTKEESSPPERDEQFRYIGRQVKRFLDRGQPVISVDTKKKERVGTFKNAGQTWRPKGKPYEVNVYDYPDLAIGTAIPYGAYDVTRNEGFVNVGVSHDTPEFAVESIRRWWRLYGRRHYPEATELLICADGGGSNGSRNRAWKFFVQELADEQGLNVTICHYPAGTSKWNKIEHRMFSFISSHWKGEPLVNYETIISLISTTKTKTGLRVRAKLDPKSYETGMKIPDEDMKRLSLRPHKFHPELNYTIDHR
ncbi:MAG: ISAzo13 family transposase, partial [Candidatus Micrarchaeota archaeon]